MPLAPGPPVRTATVSQSARRPEVMKVFSPSMTQWSPSMRAVVRSRATSEPPPGSVMASAAMASPASTAGTMRCCSAGWACSTMGGRPMLWEKRLAISPPLPARAISCAAARRKAMAQGVPPRFSG